MCLLAVGLTVKADTWTYDVTDDYTSPSWLAMIKAANGEGVISPTATLPASDAPINAITWKYTSAYTTAAPSAPQKNGTEPKGITMGGAAKYFDTVTFSTNGFAGKKITKVSVTIASVSKKVSYDVKLVCGSFSETKEHVIYQNNSGNSDTPGTAEFTPTDVASELSFSIIQTGTNTNTIGGFKFCSVSVEYVDSEGPVEPQYSNIPEDGEYSMILGESKAFPEISPTELTYTLSTEDTGIVEIDNTAKTIKGVGVGTATIKFATSAYENTYLAGEGSFKVTVEGKPAQISFQHPAVEGKLGVGIVWQYATVTAPTGASVTYSAKDPKTGAVSDVINIDPNTGEITKDDLLKAGSAIVYATTAATSEYAAGEASYAVIVTDVDGAQEPETTTIDFTTSGCYGLTTYKNSNTSAYETKATTKVEGDVTFTLAGRFMSKYQAGETGPAMMQMPAVSKNGAPAGEITISVPSGEVDYKITRIIFVGGTNQKNFTTDTEGGTYDQENYRWDAKENSTVTSVHFKNNGTSAANIEKIQVLWQPVASNLLPAELSFTQKVYNTEEGVDFEANAVVNPHDVPISYELDDCPDGTVTEADGKLTIHIPTAGSYTLKAKGETTTDYRSGLAIMRINVFPVLTPEVEGATYANGSISGTSEDAVVKFTLPSSLVNLKYTLSDTEIANPDVNMFYSYPEEGIAISKSGYLYYSMGNFGYNSPVKKIAYVLGDSQTGVSEVEAAVEGEVKYYDLSGREVKGQPEQGIYIRLQGGKAEKVLVK